jgi:hypothetical protein
MQISGSSRALLPTARISIKIARCRIDYLVIDLHLVRRAGDPHHGGSGAFKRHRMLLRPRK